MVCLLVPQNTIVNALEKTSSSAANSVPTPDWAYVYQTKTQLSISASGIAEATGILTGYAGTTTEVWIFLYLERYSNGSWTSVNSWYQSFATYRGTLVTNSSVSNGYTYRVKASYYAYSGSEYEHIVQYSSPIYY